MGWITEAFQAEERNMKLELWQHNATQELKPLFFATLCKEIVASLDEMNEALKVSHHKRKVEWHQAALYIEINYRPPVPLYKIAVGIDTDTLSVYRGDECLVSHKLVADTDLTGLVVCAADGSHSLNNRQVADAFLQRFVQEVRALKGNS